jgi:ubiquinone/menaquinone biosynthesis C-methylase UbiE
MFFEIFNPQLPRQEPGDSSSTLQAMKQVPGIGAATRVLDIGCGTGPQTLVLAHHSNAHITAVDAHEPFLKVLHQQAQAHGIETRIETRLGDMRHLDYPPGSFDLIWCEGAIYIMGFENALREWRKLLKSGGHVVVSEVCWTRRDPPPECSAFWASEYPGIRDVSAMLKAIAECHYETIDHFTLPRSSWWNEFYSPLQQSVAAFRACHENEADAQQLADRIQAEIDLWHAYGEFYHYECFVMRAG